MEELTKEILDLLKEHSYEDKSKIIAKIIERTSSEKPTHKKLP